VGVFDDWMICGLTIDEAAAYFCLAPENRQFKVLFAFKVRDSALWLMDHGLLAHGIRPPPKAIRSSTMEIKKFRFATNKKGRLSPRAHAQFTDDALEVVTRQVLRSDDLITK